jgi:hypothetical protein
MLFAQPAAACAMLDVLSECVVVVVVVVVMV